MNAVLGNPAFKLRAGLIGVGLELRLLVEVFKVKLSIWVRMLLYWGCEGFLEKFILF